MPKFQVDYTSLVNQITKRAYRLTDVQDQIERVAWDIVRFKDQDKSSELWQVQSADDGEYIVALYDGDNEKTASPWSVLVSKTAADLQVAYKGDPIVRVAAARLGIPSGELHKIPGYLPAKLAANKRLVQALLNEVPESAKKEVLSKYPELV